MSEGAAWASSSTSRDHPDDERSSQKDVWEEAVAGRQKVNETYELSLASTSIDYLVFSGT